MWTHQRRNVNSNISLLKLLKYVTVTGIVKFLKLIQIKVIKPYFD